MVTISDAVVISELVHDVHRYAGQLTAAVAERLS
jgi:hypothetical protein